MKGGLGSLRTINRGIATELLMSISSFDSPAGSEITRAGEMLPHTPICAKTRRTHMPSFTTSIFEPKRYPHLLLVSQLGFKSSFTHYPPECGPGTCRKNFLDILRIDPKEAACEQAMAELCGRSLVGAFAGRALTTTASSGWTENFENINYAVVQAVEADF